MPLIGQSVDFQAVVHIARGRMTIDGFLKECVIAFYKIIFKTTKDCEFAFSGVQRATATVVRSVHNALALDSCANSKLFLM